MEFCSILYLSGEPEIPPAVEGLLHVRGWVPCSIQQVSSLQEAFYRIPGGEYQVVLADCSLLAADRFGFLEKLDRIAEPPPVILLAQAGREPEALEGIRRGAADFLVKGTFGPQQLVDHLRALTDRERLHRQRTRTQRDISERRRIEQEIRRKNRDLREANRMQGAFLAGISHDLRAPIQGIMGFTELALKGGGMTDQQMQDLGKVMENSRRLMSMVEEILELSRIETGKVRVNLQECSLERAIRRAVDGIFPHQLFEGDLRLRIELPEELSCFQTDEPKLLRILVNLLSNAEKFTESGEIRISAVVRDGRIRVTVSDTGIGVPAGDRERIFQPFLRAAEEKTRRKKEGLGLGLAISRHLARLLGGDLSYEPNEPRGSRFHLILPLIPPESSGGRREKIVPVSKTGHS